MWSYGLKGGGRRYRNCDWVVLADEGCSLDEMPEAIAEERFEITHTKSRRKHTGGTDEDEVEKELS